MSETKTNFKNELKSAASLILTFSLPILQHYHIHQNAPSVAEVDAKERVDDSLVEILKLGLGRIFVSCFCS